jgi:hypothetical protein
MEYKCKYCEHKQSNPDFYYHKKVKHPEIMRRSYNKHSSNSSVYSASSLNSSRPPAPLLLLKDAEPIINGKKRPYNEDNEDDISVLDVDDSVRDQVEYLLEKATQLFAEGKTAEEVGVQLAKRLKREEAIHLRAEFSKQESRRISKKLKVESEFPQGQFHEFESELKKSARSYLEQKEDVSTLSSEQRQRYRDRLGHFTFQLKWLLAHAEMELSKCSDEGLAFKALHKFLLDDCATTAPSMLPPPLFKKPEPEPEPKKASSSSVFSFFGQGADK